MKKLTVRFGPKPHVRAPASLRLGERLRQLRVAAGLTQGDLGGDRFSKEYISQIERGKTRPTPETINWLAKRLGVDASFLANGVSTDERGRVEGGLARTEALTQSDRCGLLNNIDGLSFLLGKPEEAVPHLKEVFRIALHLGHEQAEEQARHALRLLDGRLGDLATRRDR